MSDLRTLAGPNQCTALECYSNPAVCATGMVTGFDATYWCDQVQPNGAVPNGGACASVGYAGVVLRRFFV